MTEDDVIQERQKASEKKKPTRSKSVRQQPVNTNRKKTTKDSKRNMRKK